MSRPTRQTRRQARTVAVVTAYTLLQSGTNNALESPLARAQRSSPPGSSAVTNHAVPLQFAAESSRRDVFSSMTRIFPMWLATGSMGLSSVAPATALSMDSMRKNTVRVTLPSPGVELGLELVEATIGTPARSVLAIRGVVQPSRAPQAAAQQLDSLRPGMVCRDFASLRDLKERVQSGPYPITLDFENLAAGGDALSDWGTPILSPQEALDVSRQSVGGTDATAFTDPERTVGVPSSSSEGTFEIAVVRPPTAAACRSIRSRRDDVLEVLYTAQFKTSDGRLVEYDSSAIRGTGQPYQMVLGSGDMLAGVDLGLYDMCPGEVRRLTIPSRIAYGTRGNAAFHIPPHSDLEWTVELVAANSMRADSEYTRDELEGRVPLTDRAFQ